MAVHFVYRSPHAGPAGKHVSKLDAPSVLAWFQQVWPEAVAAEDGAAWVKSALGTAVAGFESLFEAARSRSLPPPESDRDLKKYLDAHLDAEEVLAEPHAVQALGEEEDESEMAYYLFDDAFLQDRPRVGAFLLHEGWELPEDAIDDWFQGETPTRLLTPSGTGEGSVYLVFLGGADASQALTNLELPYRLSGVRLAGLAEHLAAATPDSAWPFELRLLRSQLPEDGSGQDALKAALKGVNRFPVVPLAAAEAARTLGTGSLTAAHEGAEKALAKFPEKGRPNKVKKTQTQLSDHLAQLCLHVGRSGKLDLYHRWLLFDDQWAAANKALANGLLRYARRWDVLSLV
jgi:hypothetical protein